MLEEDDALPNSMLAGEEGVTDPVGLEEEPWFMTSAATNKLNVAELKKEIHLRGLIPLGKKSDLMKSILDCMEQQLVIIDMPVENMNAMSGFPVGSMWTILTPNFLTVSDPVNDVSFHAPTVKPEHLHTVTKHDFDEEWDCPIFKGRNKAKECGLF